MGAGGYNIKSYRVSYGTPNSSGELVGASFCECVIELGSEVVCVFNGAYMYEPEYDEIGKILGAIQFVVE